MKRFVGPVIDFSLHGLVIDRKSFTDEQRVQTPIAIPRVGLRKRAYPDTKPPAPVSCRPSACACSMIREICASTDPIAGSGLVIFTLTMFSLPPLDTTS